MLPTCSIFRGVRLHHLRSARFPKPSGIRSIFHPFGPIPPPPPPERLASNSTETSHPHASRQLMDGLYPGYDGLVTERDITTNKSATMISSQTNAEQIWQSWRSTTEAVSLGPYAGRTVEIKRDVTITRAWDVLNSILNTNNVRRELRKAFRHEQKGEKRRRLRRERWRRRFAHEVRMKVELVMQMRNRDRMWGAKH